MGNSNSQLTPIEYEKLRKNIKLGREYVQDTPNAKLVAKMFDAYNHRDIKTLRKNITPDSSYFFQGAERGMSFDEFISACQATYASLPDLISTFDSMEELSPGVVVVTNARGYGSHIGEPISFGPYPPIAKTGIVIEERYDYTMTIVNGKVARVLMAPDEGELVGPPGHYLKVGGKITS
eukprot:Nitzschia sp. Nitz4//scaffold28_size193895//162082//162618//NITZ4_001684-RA/size193895-processed-gene-0.237-mRNA-1//1//CDS//3329546039//3527//frame0